MMEQYFEIKNQYKDHLLFYRLGDFYEMFFDDAILASRVLELTLTGRDCGEKERAPMCGVPFHSAEGYIGTLISKGYKVAICEQTEDPALAKGIVKREVVRVVTPGTVIESELLTEKENNYLCSIYMNEYECGISFADISTAHVFATSFSGDDVIAHICNEIATYQPREVITNISSEKLGDAKTVICERFSAMLDDRQSPRFDFAGAKERVKKQFPDTVSRDIMVDRALVSSLGALLSYVEDMQKYDISYMKELNVYSDDQYLEIDINTRRNLEITETMRNKERRGALVGVLDKTHTAAGARLLRQWMQHPLLSTAKINSRQNAVEELAGDYMLREELSMLLRGGLDVERLMTRIIYGTANARELRSLASTIAILPELKEKLSVCKSDELSRLYNELDTLEDIFEKVDTSISEAPPFSIREGNMIKDGYDAEVDELRSILNDGKSWLERMAEEEREATGIKLLKINYNRVFGYYIEVTKSFMNQVPDRYIRKQTLANCERYITPELKDLESRMLGASDRVAAIEYELFCEIRQFVAENNARIRKAAADMARIDVYLSLANVAVKNNYVRPEVDCGSIISIRNGRHPVVEQFVKDTYFVPNDTYLDTERNRLMLITGPNMAGKSTYMRQVAIIVLLAQIGSFVPASEARIGIVDKLFTRVGASDDLASGQSTFMLEMNEVAYILRNATKRSLIIYDEVGRGTSTFDGMSIAKAIAEYTCGKKIGAKTLFATHYHELTSLEDEVEGVVNYNIAAKKKGDNITFLRKILRGSTDDSYGIEVAKLAGVPNEVIKRAKEVLVSVESTAKAISECEVKPKEVDDTLISFDDCIKEQVIEELKAVDINTLSPYEAMSLLFELQKRLK
ncbi:MAG: DNA mismatch repair protein MutS [Ruminococcaceae bacterium]|nr:DNA mismatch repair protein MutS [Oscillospiraceae bacterium]